jgi:HlyD family type I secretion membrane fusion protein
MKGFDMSKKQSLADPELIHSEVESVLGVSMESEPNSKRLRWWGLGVLVAFVGGLSAWSALAPIESATMADGKLIVEGQQRVVQPYESGEISKILVKEDQNVQQGQLLIQLDDTRARSTYDATLREYFNYLAMENRLLAERDDESAITFDPELLSVAKESPRYEKLVQAQRALFIATRKSMQGSITILNQQIAQTHEQIKGVQSQLKSVEGQYDLIQQEIKPHKILVKKQLLEKHRLLELQRHAAQLAGQRGEYQANIAALNQRVSEIEAKINTFSVDYKQQVLTSLRETQQALTELRKRKVLDKDILDHTQLRAPLAGTVVGMKFHSAGAVVSPSEALLQIMPDDEFVVEARVSPNDIDVVHKGLQAKLQFVSLKSRNVPAVIGTVSRVISAATLDSVTGQSYYRVLVTINRDQMDFLSRIMRSSHTKLTADMPVTVMIVNEKRTFMSYLFTPVRESFNRAFREQ